MKETSRLVRAVRALCNVVLLVGTTARADGQASARIAQLSLHDAIEQAQHGLLARQAQDRVDAAAGLVTQAGLRPNPRLYLQSEDLRPWADNFSFPNATEDYGYLGQLVEVGGKRGSRVGLAKASLRQSEAEQALQLQEVAGRVAAAYWAAVVSRKVVTLLEEDRQAVDQIVRYNKARVDAGAMRGIDLIRVEIERDRLLLALGAARRDAALTRADLSRQIGRSLPIETELSGTLDEPFTIESKSLAVVLTDRLDVAVAREALDVAQADVRLQRSLGRPDLDLLGGYKRNNGTNTIYTSLQLPLAFRNRNQGEVAKAEANVHLAQDRLQQLEISVEAELMGAQEAYMQQQRVVTEVLPEMRRRAKQNLAIMDDAYRTGGVDLLRYVDAERTAFDVEVNALRTLAELRQTGLRLQLAYGVHP